MKEIDREETEQWLKTFMSLYQQAIMATPKISEVDRDGVPTDVTALREISIKLLPILKSVKEMPKPKNKELRRLKKDLKLTLEACISASKWGIKLNQKSSRLRFSTTIFWTSLAISFKESLSKNLAALTQNLNYGR
jgi:hypothetical protein